MLNSTVADPDSTVRVLATFAAQYTGYLIG
jgi:hypothetical protein